MDKLFIFIVVLAIILFTNSVNAENRFNRLDIVENDIDSVQIKENSVWLKLTSSASNKLTDITKHHTDERLHIYLQDLMVIEATIITPIESGIIYVKTPSKKLIKKAEFILETLKIKNSKIITNPSN